MKILKFNESFSKMEMILPEEIEDYFLEMGDLGQFRAIQKPLNFGMRGLNQERRDRIYYIFSFKFKSGNNQSVNSKEDLKSYSQKLQDIYKVCDRFDLKISLRDISQILFYVKIPDVIFEIKEKIRIIVYGLKIFLCFTELRNEIGPDYDKSRSILNNIEKLTNLKFKLQPYLPGITSEKEISYLVYK